jgi:hypothetical protein
MKLLLFATALVAFAGLPVAAVAQTAPAGSELGILQKTRAKLVGKWINFSGDVIEFTDNSMVTMSSPQLPTPFKGTFVLTADMQLRMTINGNVITSEFSVDSALLRIKTKSGNFAEHQRYDNKNVADLTLREIKVLDSAIDMWAIEKRKREGDKPTNEDLRKYIRKECRLYWMLNDPAGLKDLLGNSYGVLTVGRGPKVHPATAKAVSADVPRTFWEGFIE